MLAEQDLITLIVGPHHPPTPERLAAAKQIAAYLRHDTDVVPDGVCLPLARLMKGFLVPEIRALLHLLVDSGEPGRALSRRFVVAEKVVRDISFHYMMGAGKFMCDWARNARMGHNAKGEILIDGFIFSRLRKDLVEVLIDARHDFIFGPRASCAEIVASSGYPVLVEVLDGFVDRDALATLKLLPIAAGAVQDDYDFSVTNGKVRECVVDVIRHVALMFPATS
ncbi:MAG TPA: hypothetical protein VGE52_08160 [Pirellulales bacterium]